MLLSRTKCWNVKVSYLVALKLICLQCLECLQICNDVIAWHWYALNSLGQSQDKMFRMLNSRNVCCNIAMLQSCFQALRSPDKISGQNVETIVSKSIALKLALFAMLGMFANMQWCSYTLCYYALSSLGKSQDKMFGMLDSINICWILRKVSNGRVLGTRLRPGETCGAWGRSS